MSKHLFVACIVVVLVVGTVDAQSNQCKTDADFAMADAEFGKCLNLNFAPIYITIEPGLSSEGYCSDSVKGLKACQSRYDKCYSPLAVRFMLRAQLETHYDLSEKFYDELNKVNAINIRRGEEGGNYREICRNQTLDFGSAATKTQNCNEAAIATSVKSYEDCLVSTLGAATANPKQDNRCPFIHQMLKSCEKTLERCYNPAEIANVAPSVLNAVVTAQKTIGSLIRTSRPGIIDLITTPYDACKLPLSTPPIASHATPVTSSALLAVASCVIVIVRFIRS